MAGLRHAPPGIPCEMNQTRVRQSIRVALGQIRIVPGQPIDNTERILAAIAQAKRKKADMVVFPEMAVPGYLIGDNWERHAFLRECEACGERIRESAAGITVVFGNVGLDWNKKNEDGRVRKYNALFVAENRTFARAPGSPYRFVIKSLSPNYREFDESRYFYDARKLAMELRKRPEEMISPLRACGLSVGCLICEDAWDSDYNISPVQAMAGKPLDLVVNCSSSPFTLNKAPKRHRIFAGQAVKLGRPLVYVNNVGIQNNGKTVYSFDGSSCIYDPMGQCLPAGPRFREKVSVLDVPLRTRSFGAAWASAEDGIEAICEALVFGLRAFADQCRAEKITVGLSGGIDSAVVSALCTLVLGRENILLVNMPGPYTSRTTVALARAIARNLGCYYAEIPIADSVALTERQIDRLQVRSLNNRMRRTLRLTRFMLENVQARDRSARVLAAAAAAFGGVFTCNANKAEATVGYSTLYGDLAGFLAPIGDLWKREVYALARHLNQKVFKRAVIPDGCLALTPSAELSTAQNVDRGKGDPLIYPYHDRLFASWTERWDRITPEEIAEWRLRGCLEKEISYDGDVGKLFGSNRRFLADLERWWDLYCGMGIAKRIQAPPVLAIHRRSFGFGQRESQIPVWYSARYRALKRRLLAAD